MNTRSNGSLILARGALQAGVRFVTGYPGSPTTAVVEELLSLAGDLITVDWAINEKSAFDTAFGVSLAGLRSLLCIKSVGLNVALDSLMVSNLATGDGGFVVLVGDDPGGWGSQNEQDSRVLVEAAQIPLLEPTTLDQAFDILSVAFDFSQQYAVPVVVRITRDLISSQGTISWATTQPSASPSAHFERDPERYNVLPIQVVDFHKSLLSRVQQVQSAFETSHLNKMEGTGSFGVIAAGYSYRKVKRALALSGAEGSWPKLRVLRLGSLYPLPEGSLLDFLSRVDETLVVEETAPVVETGVQALAQRAGLAVSILGRFSGHIPWTGELSARDLDVALGRMVPAWPRADIVPAERAMPSRSPLCDDCPYVPIFETLLDIMESCGGRDRFVITGETGCMVRAQLPPLEILDLKYGMGSSIGLGAGLARSGIPQKVIALAGDSALLHSGLGELVDAAQKEADLLVLVLANGTTALSGGQPHPASAVSASGRPQNAIDLQALILAAGVPWVQTVDALDREGLWSTIWEGLGQKGTATIIAQHPCPRWVHVEST